MASKTTSFAVLGLLAALALSSTGCLWGVTTVGPSMGILAYPIPVSPFFQDKKEDEFWMHQRYDRVPIMGPLSAEGPAVALDPPSDDEVMRAFDKAKSNEGGIPLLYGIHRNNVRIVKDKIADYVDPPRVYPLVGPAQQHHAQYKCTVYYEEVTRVGWPIPHTLTNEDATQVVYIDHNHLHMVGNVDTGASSNF
jgi:hypothetical protein